MTSTPYETTGSVTLILGGAAADLVGFHGEACAQAATIAAVVTTSPTTTTPYGFTTTTQFNTLIAAVNSIITANKNKGLLASS